MGAPSKRARKIRTAPEFDTTRLSTALSVPKASTGIALTSWTLTQIFEARDAQLRGHFYLPARMAEAMRTDDALAVALENRLAPQRCIKVEIVPGSGARAESVAKEAEALFGQCGVGISADTMASIHACLTNHDIAFGVCTATPREDGSRIDVEMHAWPIEHVRWDPIYKCFMTRVDPVSVSPGDTTNLPADPTTPFSGAPFLAGAEVPIVHGDGRWVIFQRFEVEPFKHAAILAAAAVWGRHAYAVRDWAKSSVAHGNAKMIGKLPEGQPLQDSGGNTAEAEAMIAAMRSLVTGDAAVAVLPAGATAEFITNQSSAWQVFSELVLNAEKAAARIYLGTDGTLGTQGGAPGIDIQSLFGVATTKVQGDLACLQRAIDTGVIQPWCALNFGDSTLAPSRVYCVPDADEETLKKSLGERTAAFSAALKGRVESHIPLTQADVDGLAADFGVRAPVLPVKPAVADSAAVAPLAPALRRV